MLNLEYARDLVMTGALFGVVTFVWAGWGQERPPKGVIWRVLLVLLQVGGLVLAGFGIAGAIRHWDTPTTLASGSPALTGYIVVFWLEVAAIIALTIFYVRTDRTFLVAPTVLIIVGVHFVPLAFVFGQPLIMVAAILITAVGIVVLFLPREVAAPSFWCGILSGPVFLGIGTWALVAGLGALGS
ncbi:hypothetical protein [Microbacterium pygmaeum]|uniref:Uncharacterized protein n=1 Tax=Microbacterium pygmaeum TaxID=370764 RepID=A0A1G7UK37_9MICO|nr:hypothetical protein [Microbacterium pygmaeum]SDG47922.1 hypothetical protein SAMN04489810_0410 [Microbacterium pygmaeum]